MRLAVILFLLMVSVSTNAAEPSNFIGLWGNETVSGPLLSGALTIDGRQTPWRASVAGMSAVVEHNGDKVSFAMPGGQGRFRGQLVNGNVEGFWIQPPGQTTPSAYATPLMLAPGKEAVWVAQLHPLQEQIRQYLRIERAGDGSLKALLVNPEFNLGHGVSYVVTVKKDAIVLTDPKRTGWALNGRLDEDSDQLLIDWQGIGVFAFTRRDRDHAIGYYASTPAASQPSYSAPIAEDDGWATASLADVGMHRAPMLDLQQKIQSRDTPAGADPMVYSVLVARHGKLVFETYLHGYSRELAHDMRSAGKSFASLLVGMAIDHGANFSPQTPVLSLFPPDKPFEHLDQRKRAMTVGDLMDMSSGLACDDDDDHSPGGEDKMQRQHAERDWYRFTLNLPMAHAPGADKAVYCSAGINLLGGVVREATGRSLVDLFQQWIAEPMQMRGYHLNLMPDDDLYLAGGLQLRPRDMLKLGQLYLDGGLWNGRRLIDQRWIDASVTRHTTFGPNHDYGYAWHLHTFRSEGHDYRGYAAEGNGGQFVIVVPELDLVVVITAGNYGQFSVWYPLQTLIGDYVIPAATRAGAP